MTIETYTVTADPPQIPDADKPVVAQAAGRPARHDRRAGAVPARAPRRRTDTCVLAKGVSTANEAKIQALGLTGIYA